MPGGFELSESPGLRISRPGAAARKACSLTPPASIRRMQSAAFVKKLARAATFWAWCREWTTIQNHPTHHDPRAYGHSIDFHQPPDGCNHPLWLAAIPPKKPDKDHVHITCRTHCTAFQLATLHSFTSDYTSCHRLDLPPEAAHCPCGFQDQSFYHLVYNCEHYTTQRWTLFSEQSRTARIPENTTPPIDLFTGDGGMPYAFGIYNNSDISN
ncbi:hypothetical protein EDB86DRAFT_3087192 [Lactarius hatsudake]|nr:hypothetical protein EDB86DRAFT_3087192 [Lactarius hatsudake]